MKKYTRYIILAVIVVLAAVVIFNTKDIVQGFMAGFRAGIKGN